MFGLKTEHLFYFSGLLLPGRLTRPHRPRSSPAAPARLCGHTPPCGTGSADRPPQSAFRPASFRRLRAHPGRTPPGSAGPPGPAASGSRSAAGRPPGPDTAAGHSGRRRAAAFPPGSGCTR